MSQTSLNETNKHTSTSVIVFLSRPTLGIRLHITVYAYADGFIWHFNDRLAADRIRFPANHRGVLIFWPRLMNNSNHWPVDNTEPWKIRSINLQLLLKYHHKYKENSSVLYTMYPISKGKLCLRPSIIYTKIIKTL